MLNADAADDEPADAVLRESYVQFGASKRAVSASGKRSSRREASQAFEWHHMAGFERERFVFRLRAIDMQHPDDWHAPCGASCNQRILG